METVWEDGKAAASSRPPYQLTPGNYRFVWNAGADLPDSATADWQNASPTYTDVCDTQVWWKVSAPNYQTVEGTIGLKITRPFRHAPHAVWYTMTTGRLR